MKDTEEQLYATGEKLIAAYEKIDKLEKLLDKAVKTINKMLKDDPDCELCLWKKDCESGKSDKICMECAQWVHSPAVTKLIGDDDDE